MDHPRNIDQITRQKGFTLIEVFFAIFIIVFVLFASQNCPQQDPMLPHLIHPRNNDGH